MHHAISLDPCSTGFVAVVLTVTALKVGQAFHRHAGAMAWAAVATLLAVGAAGYVEIKPSRGAQVVGLLIVAWTCAAAAALAAAVLVPPLASVWDGCRRAASRHKAEAAYRTAEARQRAEEATAARLLEESRRRAEEERRNRPPPPPPPTKAERAEMAAREYEETLARIDRTRLDEGEKNSARERAKQKYLNQLNEAL